MQVLQVNQYKKTRILQPILYLLQKGTEPLHISKKNLCDNFTEYFIVLFVTQETRTKAKNQIDSDNEFDQIKLSIDWHKYR